ncbi:2-dehydropantoate 2-reductase (Ketopantoate reductase) (KPA reductase) (KPR) [Coemansia sp. RSA 2706]|nr:2-dehydropantoate 2-reductase (Ketopantoate reductase) (KPA reductase) (KPR) [Coemansia sp. RSA 2706]
MSGSGLSRIHILGAGAVGLLFAAHLRQAGHPITLLLRTQAAVDRFERQGCRISVVNDWMRANPARSRLLAPGEPIAPCAVDDIQAETPAGTHAAIGKLILATKAQDTLRAFADVRSRLDAQSTVVMLQNGMGAFEAIQRELYAHAAAPAFIVGTNAHGCLRRASDEFSTHHTAMGTCRLALRPAVAGSAPPDSALELLTALGALPLDVAVVNWSELQPLLLLKLAANAIINPATALAGCHNRSMHPLKHTDGHAGIQGFVVLACAEIAAIYARAHPHLHAELSAQAIEEYVAHIIDVTAQNRSSMLQDVAGGRPTEVEWINGYLVRLGQQHGVPTPVNAALYGLVKLKESTARE